MKRLADILSAALVLAMLGPAPAAEPETGQAAEVDRMFARWDRPDVPGCAVGIVRDGQQIYAKGFGSANLESEASNTPQTVFEIGSLSKAFTCICLALLLDQGRIAADDDLRKYAFSNIFEVAGAAAPFERVAVVQNLDYVAEVMRVEGDSPWYAAPHDEFALVMDGTTTDVGEILEADPPRRLSYTFHHVLNEAAREEPPTKVVFTLEKYGNLVKLTLTHENFATGSALLDGISKGWPAMIHWIKRKMLMSGRPAGPNTVK